ncbi:phage morphogenesis protein, partial [Haemophilus influenzae]|nr:phage morphogenesis protein [Haemophilus influenzae]
LIIRTVEFDSTIQQVAHAFYGDYTRAGELLRLNPHIRYPNFIARGEVLNGYAK